MIILPKSLKESSFLIIDRYLNMIKVLLILLLFRWAASLLFGRLLLWNVVALAGPVLVASALEGSPGGGVLGCASGGRGGHVE